LALDKLTKLGYNACWYKSPNGLLNERNALRVGLVADNLLLFRCYRAVNVSVVGPAEPTKSTRLQKVESSWKAIRIGTAGNAPNPLPALRTAVDPLFATGAGKPPDIGLYYQVTNMAMPNRRLRSAGLGRPPATDALKFCC
jgi:hypothetical protein